MNDILRDRMIAHRSAPDVYDPPTFEQMADRIEKLEAKLERAVELALMECPFQFGTPDHKDWWSIRRTNLEELKGQDDE